MASSSSSENFIAGLSRVVARLCQTCRFDALAWTLEAELPLAALGRALAVSLRMFGLETLSPRTKICPPFAASH